jgi:hypothetical protein
MRGIVALGALAALLGTSGCGPVMSTYLILSAQAELDGAKTAEAEKYAVYEYVSAEQYLAKAREEQGYADFGPSIDYAYKAQALAKKARERATEQRHLEDPAALETGEVTTERGTEVEIVPIAVDEGTRPPE